MKILSHLATICLTTFAAQAIEEANSATSAPLLVLTPGSGEITLSWSGGRPSYQLQSRSSFAEPWRNIGTPTSSTSVMLPTAESVKFFRVVSDYTARFEVLFNATWSAQSHPGAWPPGAHWSGPVGGVHDESVHFWKAGETASEGIRLMAERGQQRTLAAEIEAAIPTGHALFTMTAGGLDSPAQRVISFPRATTRDYPLLTLCSMIAPSPDWFIGVAGLSLIDAQGQWISEQTVILDGYDAGTDSGIDFTSPDQVTSPRSVVTRFTGYPALINGQIVPFGTFTIRRIE